MAELFDEPWKWVVFFCCTFLTGIAKSGIQGVGSLTIPIYALLFGAKASTGIILPSILVADIMSAWLNRHHIHFTYILHLIPWAAAGLILALFTGKNMPSVQFGKLMAACILAGLIVMTVMQHHTFTHRQKKWLRPLFGILAGFSALIGNAAGPVVSVYLLTMRLPKYAFVTTSIWFIFIMNVVKLPIQIFVWENIPPTSFLLALFAIPCILLGAFTGKSIIRILPEKGFRIIITILVIISTLLMIIR
ncbi:sulfite exporter TauE/SafE family protein [Coprobacter tertius]|uniref:Probable membrane transporter protein n=1 Tax=Coprobacter tertius TaxID=2944915 RepID=A0ABT1MF41_9BACT|nr:sulfite exporter TauE/SafE family protein [Coprobacter tertius]MCP9610674.1 sulfite exporter TauE/SafE family protein [Coprobacter tertius]